MSPRPSPAFRPAGPGPILSVALALAAGAAAGLLLSDRTGFPAGLLLAIGAAAAGAALRPKRASPTRPRSPRPVPLFLLVACLCAGGSLGLRSGRTVAASCLARLADGERLTAVGVAARTLSAGRRDAPSTSGRSGGSAHSGRPARSGDPGRISLRRLELKRVGIELAGGPGGGGGPGRCRVPALSVRVDPPSRRIRAGEVVRVTGRWRRYGASEGNARPLRRFGALRGRIVPPAAGATRGGTRIGADRASREARAGGAGGVVLTLRSGAARRVARRVPADVAPLAAALTLAERGDVPPALSRRFADAGLAHLLAISGLHVGVLAGGILWLSGLVLGRRPRRYPVAAGLVAGYVALIGAPPAAVRAAILFAGWSGARALGRPVRVTELLGAAAAVTILAAPTMLLDVGFQLSFAGFTGLLIGGGLAERAREALARRGRAPPPRVRHALLAVAAGTGAFALTAPLAALHFQRAAPVAILANFIGVPLVTLALAALAGVVFLPGAVGELAGAAAGSALRALVRAVDALASLPGGHGEVAPPGAVFWVSAILLFAAALLVLRGGSAARAALPAGAALAAWLAGPVVLAAGPDRTLVCQIDVGQGDAAAVRTRAGHWAVLDAGPRGRGWGGGAGVVPFLRDRGARSVDLFVLSHPHLDHLGGARSLFRRFRVARVLDAGNPHPSGAYAAFLEEVEEEGARWVPARAGDRIRLDEVEITVLSPGAEGSSAARRPGSPPAPPLWSGPPRDANETSVAIRVRVRPRGERRPGPTRDVRPRFSYVNTGDASAEQEAAMLARWTADSLRADVLKAGHHGSRSSSAPAWIAGLDPRVVVISAGAGNRYGHPHAATLRRLRGADVPRVWRTDREGTMCVEVRPGGDWRLEGEARWRRAGRQPSARARPVRGDTGRAAAYLARPRDGS